MSTPEPKPEPEPEPEPAARLVTCPCCRRAAVYGPANPWRPFCGERCRNIDLGAWASEDYRVPAQTPPDAPAAPGEPAPRE